ncbi:MULTISPECIES: helix-turn-helix transcriptional regulator [Bacillus]|uniref:helix-turn-helix transcriptional regulator n=1 Tax=Bacillus TaxID=1386 RepID=UPI000BB83C33|nr:MULTISPECIES: helix-turn-helix domain-containing protein [Bacillus]
MKKKEVIELISSKFKLIRTERGYTQDEMAEVLGISKKTLVQIEKERTDANWTTVIAICALFKNSEILHAILGPTPLEVIETVAHEHIFEPRDKTLGGKVWWKEIKTENGYRLQQNVVSQHFRIINEHDYRLFSSFDKEEANRVFKQVMKSS